MGLPDWHDYLEAGPLKLTAEHIPLPCSLLEPVLQRYAQPQAQSMDMDMDDLLAYLRDTKDLALSPLQSVFQQTESIGDPAQPSVEQTAILHWLGDAFEYWEQHYPLDAIVCQELRRLKPLAACLAVSDPEFLVPGAHPLHRILDSLQLGAVGWQESLGRAGHTLRKQLDNTVRDALAWFDDRDTDLEQVCRQIVDATERDQVRAARMAQRVIEAERGLARTTEVRRIAAQLINTALAERESPAIIGEFLKGPWYDSAQLVLLKFGADSAQWEQMSASTHTLLDSVQFTREDADLEIEGNAERRQRLFELVSQLPRELKRWLLSLQHDAAAVEQAIGMVEHAHMQILRKNPLPLEAIELIPVPSRTKTEAAKQELASLQAGQWLCIDSDGGEAVRVKLVQHIEEAGELLFVNLAGIKVLQTGWEEIARLMSEGRISTLDSGASFSLSLARAAGVDQAAHSNGAPDAAVEAAESAGSRTEERPREPGTDQQLQAPHAAAEQPAVARQPPSSILATGTWVGFHDGEAPLLAKLAVHDRENDHYIFVNRSGIKMRQLNSEDLQRLMDDALVDVLETRSSFRDQVTRVKRRPGD